MSHLKGFTINLNATRKPPVRSAERNIGFKHPDLSVKWKDTYSLPFSVSLNSILNIELLFTNDKLFHFNIIDSPLCAFVKHESNPLSICSIIVKFQKVSGIYSLPG